MNARIDRREWGLSMMKTVRICHALPGDHRRARRCSEEAGAGGELGAPLIRETAWSITLSDGAAAPRQCEPQNFT
jgi:hypothetical protein